MNRLAKLLGALALTIAALASSPHTTVLAQEQVKQIKLTEKHVTQFIAAQPDMASVQKKVPANQPPGPLDPKLVAEFEAVSKKHGFANLTEYDEVFSNISMIMSLYDPSTNSFVEPKESIRKQIEEVKADKSLSAEDRKQILSEMEAAMKAAEPIAFPENVALVKKHREKLDAAMQ